MIVLLAKYFKIFEIIFFSRLCSKEDVGSSNIKISLIPYNDLANPTLCF